MFLKCLSNIFYKKYPIQKYSSWDFQSFFLSNSYSLEKTKIVKNLFLLKPLCTYFGCVFFILPNVSLTAVGK